MAGGTLYLFSSNTADLYLQDALNVLALPNGAICHFRYNVSWVDPQLLPRADQAAKKPQQALQAYAGTTALVVLVRQPPDKEARKTDANITFYPLRRAEVHRMEMDGTVLHVYFCVKDYVDWRQVPPDVYNQAIRTALPDTASRPARKYLAWTASPLPDKIQLADAEHATEAWQSVVDALHEINGGLPELGDALFYRVGGLRRIRKSDRTENLQKILKDQSGYDLSSAHPYALDISIYHPDDLTAHAQKRSLEVVVDDSYFAYTPESIPNNFRYDKRTVALVPKMVTQDAVTRVVLKPVEAAEKAAVVNDGTQTSPRVWAPQLTLLLRIKYPRTQRRVGLGILVLAQLMVAVSGKWDAMSKIIESWTETAGKLPITVVGEPLFAVLGALLTALAVYVIFRKSP